MSLFDTTHTLFAEVLLPVPIPKLFTYRVPQELTEYVQKGQRAIVQFGDRKIVTGIIAHLQAEPPVGYEAKYLLDILDEQPAITELQLTFFLWMADYYCCTAGEVLQAALPAGLKLSSESRVQLHPSFDWGTTAFRYSDKEELLLQRLAQESLSYTDISSLLGIRNIYAVLKSLTKKEAILLFEEVKDTYKPKVERRVRLKHALLSNKKLEVVFQQLSSKPKQEDILLKYLQHISALQDSAANQLGLPRSVLLAEGSSDSSLNTLVKNEIFEEFERQVSRFESTDLLTPHSIQLSVEQQQAEREILSQFEKFSTVLLHGVTGSGKTEIYIRLVQQALAGGSQALMLLPEIALTTQIVHRLKKVFGNTLGIYHSRFSDNERVEVWRNIQSGQFKFVVGVRSSIFLPFENLGLIIVDEEHDASYKQQEPAPRYHARDSALWLAQLHHAKVLLGSATPGIETFYQAQQQKFGLVTLAKRYADAQLPSFVAANMQAGHQQKTTKGEFSQLLLQKIESTLAASEQVIIFQNRRGYSPTISCEDCGWIPKCVNCSVSLTYHQFRHSLVCHYCGYKESMPQQCPTCSSNRIKTIGYGTEKLEEELKLHFADATVQRMDLDTTRSKNSYETILEEFEKGKTQILVGTQMITKGLDFGNVNLVGIFNADRMLHFPDFRSYERAFQLITQVSGRAGRRKKPGEVVIQTSQPEHPVLAFVYTNDYEGFFRAELTERRQHAYPPFTRLIEVTFKHVDKKVCRNASEQYAQAVRALPHVLVMGPGEPMIAKIRNQYLMTLLVKVARGNQSLAALKHTLLQTADSLQREKEFRTLRVVIDVDPV
jgi:primosomal protein N' (replication factor Y) (superfamily II helicase)